MYIDSSVLVAYYFPEKNSEKVDKLIATAQEIKLFVSWLSDVEMYSAIAKKVRTKEISKHLGLAILKEYDADIKSRYYHRIDVNTEHFWHAKELIGNLQLNLRTLDGLHLAISKTENLTLITSDKQLAKVAEQIGSDYQLID